MAHHNYSSNKIALAGALAVSIIYSILSLLRVVLPNQMLNLIQDVHQLKNADQLLSQLTIKSYLIGLLFHFVLVYLAVWLAAFIYEALSNKHKNHY